MSPGLVAGVLIVLITAQAVRVVAPRRVRYVWLLVIAAAGFVLGELFALASGVGGPLLGGLHPVADVVAICAAEAGGALLAPGRRAP